MVFSDSVMRERLPDGVYEEYRQMLRSGLPLTREIAGKMACAMKDWAIEKGATHYSHWFQPLTGVTAEKHDSFIFPAGDKVIMEFSGKELIRGEPDASSLPSGGLRATFEARGYTAWDPTSFAFIKDNTLCIPTAFCSYTGAVLDKKTPLLRSMDELSQQAARILRLFGHEDVKHVTACVGAEQEYFLVDRSLYKKRPDLVYTGRTLFGARPPKGQELDDHYFGAIKRRVSLYMKELDEELWKLGVLVKTEHNESAPAQHELAPIYTDANIAADHNQLTMELLKRVAERHGLKCILFEKPFEGINGSGKHVNWSMATDDGINLLEPGASPRENAQFLLILAAIIKAVDKHQDLLRISAASAGNDHRLGAHEAPPAIVSVSLGEDLTRILQAIEGGREYGGAERSEINIGVDVLPRIPKDTADRNRTSPFAFTGNKFEFRMLGSASSISDTVIAINTIVADELSNFADELEKAKNFTGMLNILIRDAIKCHKRIIFNGNNYADEWIAEAKARGLLNDPTTADALPRFASEKNIRLFEKHGIYSRSELTSRRDIQLLSYVKHINIEALTMLDMARRDILPAAFAYAERLASGAEKKRALGVKPLAELPILERISTLAERILEKTDLLQAVLNQVNAQADPIEASEYTRTRILPAMQALREPADEAESLIPGGLWPYPTCGELIFSV